MSVRRLCLACLLVLAACSGGPPEPTHLVFHLDRTTVPDEDVRVGLQTVQRRLDAFHLPEARMMLSGDSLIVTVGPASPATRAEVEHALAGPGRLRLSAIDDGLAIDLHPLARIDRTSPNDLQVTLAEEDAEAAEALTRGAIGHRLLLSLDGEALFQPLVREPLRGRQVVISSPDEASLDRLDAVLSTRPLPFRLSPR